MISNAWSQTSDHRVYAIVTFHGSFKGLHLAGDCAIVGRLVVFVFELDTEILVFKIVCLPRSSLIYFENVIEIYFLGLD
jgi:hypothetical protein